MDQKDLKDLLVEIYTQKSIGLKADAKLKKTIEKWKSEKK